MNVVAVDDESLALNILIRELRKIPEIHTVTGFGNGSDALNFIAENEIDMVLLDISMPGMDGLTLAKKIKARQPGALIIFVTGYSEYAVDAYQMHAAGYLVKPVTAEAIRKEIDYWKNPIPLREKTRRVRIQTFGNFDVFVDDTLLLFPHIKAKELLAYLVDRRGSSAATAEISAVLWEDAPYDRNMKNRVQNAVSNLMKTLREYGVEDIVVKGWNTIAINASKVDCDYYRYLSNDIEALNAYKGEYMTNYSWAELTAGAIAGR